MPVVVDTNVVLSAVTDRNTAQRTRAERLFQAVAAGNESLVLPQFVLFEIHYVLRNLYGRSDAEISSLLEDLTSLPGTEGETVLPLERLFLLWPGTIREMADAALTAIADARGDTVATFDAKLAKRLRALGVSVWEP